jgi:vacuolar protein sorting-associated protein 41
MSKEDYESDESYDSSEESEESEDEEDDEPKLKYQRLGAAVGEILKKDAATAMSVHDKFLALGTRDGLIAVLDFNGNQIAAFKPHGHSITELSIDSTGEFVGCSSNNGKVVIYGLYSKEIITENYRRPVFGMPL